MDTLTLHSIQQPPRVHTLLHEWVENLGVLPEGARAIRERGELSRPLARIVRMAVHIGRSWACWVDERQHVWLFIAELSPMLSRERGAPVLQIDQYREGGELKDAGTWVIGQDGKWRRCAH